MKTNGGGPQGREARTFERRHMKVIRRACLLCLITLLLCAPTARGATAHVEVLNSFDRYPAGGTYPLLFRIHISNHWFIHETGKGADALIPSRLWFKESPDLRITDIRFPEPQGKRFPFSKELIKVYSGTFLVRASLVVGKRASPGEKKIRGSFSYQACSSNACRPPETIPVRVSLTVAEAGTETSALNQAAFERAHMVEGTVSRRSGWQPGAGFLLTLIGIFFGGLALNLTPCVYPLIPITVSYFGGRSQKTRGVKVLHGLLYMLGLALTNSLLGVIAALSGDMLGSALQSPAVLILVAGVLLSLAMSFFGIWEIRLPPRLVHNASKNLGGYVGSLFMGLTLGVVAAPCIGPFLLGLLTFVGQKGDPLLGFIYFFVLSIGLGLPFAILAIFSSSMEHLPLSGEWMVWIRKCFGWILVGMAGYMILPLFHSPLFQSSIVAAVLIGAGLHLGWIDRSRSKWRGFRYMRRAVGIGLLAAAIIPFFTIPREGPGIRWVPYEPSLILNAERHHTPVILDFYADWCTPCRAMDGTVFRDPEVVALSKKFLTMRVDLTRHHSNQKELLKEYSVRGVPTIIFFNRKGIEERRLRVEELVGKGELLSRMREVLR